MAFVLLGAGLLFATSAETARGTQLRSDRPDIQALIRAEDERYQERMQRLITLRDEVDHLTERRSATDGEVAAVQNAAQRLSTEGGLDPVRGPALRVTLDDAPYNLPTRDRVKPDDLVVHQQDVQAVVNALWSGGAEAMMLQDQRVVSTSAVRCVGNTLILNGRTYGPPFTITAIGDLANLRQALDRSPGVAYYKEWVEAVQLGYKVEELSSATLPGYNGSLQMQYATVADSTETGPTETGPTETGPTETD